MISHPFADDPIERERCPECGAPGLLVDVVLTPEPRSSWRCIVCPERRLAAALGEPDRQEGSA